MLGRRDFGHVAFMLNAQHPGRPLETRFSLVADNLSKIFPGLGDSLSGTISIGLPPRGSGVEIAPLHDELLGAAFGLDDLNARVVEYRQDVRTEWAERFNTPGSYAVKDADGPADPSRATPLTDERSILTEAPTPHHRTQALPESFAKTRKAQLDSVTDGALAALAVEITDPGAVINDKPVWTLQEIHDNFFRKGDWGTKFPLTYSFPQVIPAGYLKPNGDPKEGQEGEGFSPFHQSQINATIALMDLLGDIIAPDFTNAGLTTDSVFRFSNTTQEAGGGSGSARANGPWQPDAVRGDVWIYHDVASNFDLGLGETGRATLAHEIGHILGLAHPGEYDASDEDPATYENSAEYFQDSNQYTIMSYFGASNTQSGERTGPEDGFLLHDIYALQRKYGVEMSTRTGDTTYGYNANTGGTIQDSVFNLDVNHSPRFTIWDAGGEDTLDASGMVTPAELDLRPGSFSSIGSRLNGSVTIPAGETIARFEIETVTDSLAESEETFTLTLSRNRSGTNLPSDLDDGNIGILATGSIWDTTDAPILISVADSTVTEGDDLVFTFSLDRADPVDVTVDWSVNFSTASAADLTPGTSLSGTLVIPAGDVEAKLAFPTVADILDETTETLRLSLSNPSANARVAIDPTNFIGTIHDPGVTSTPTVTLSSARGNEGETLGFVVSLDQAREKETKLFYDVLPDTVSWHDLAPGNSYTHNVSIAYDSAVDDTDHDPFKKRDVWIENAIGGAGDDLLQGNDADNRMFGGAGNDIFYGGAGNDSLGGGSGDDTFYGGAQVDDFYGGDGRDTVFLESVLSYWHVDLEGGTAVNEFWSEAFEDIEDLTTSYGNDIIELSNSDNSVSALDGDDIIYSAGGGIDLIYGGFGQDLLSYERLETGVTVNLQNLQFQGVFAQGSAVIDNLIHSIENLTGSEFDDNIRGNSGANSLLGLGGDDVIRGTAYHNYLHGGLGDDTIVSGTGNDTAVGGNGTDLLSFSESGVGVTVALYLGTAAGADIGVDTWFGMEGLIGSDHSDHLAGSMESDTLHGGEDGDILESLYGHDTAYGGAGRDTIFLDTEAPPPNQTGDIREGDDVGYGGKGLDVVYGGGGNDSLFGDEDEDYLFGGDDDDQLFGGEDNDTLNGGDGDDLLDGDAGFDFADYGSAGAGVVVDLNIAGVQQTVGAGKDTLSRIEGLFGSVFDDHFIGTTHSGRALYGQGGSDTLQAGTGDDSLFGGTQDDLIRDALGNDTIDGGSGTDTYEVLAPHSSVKIDLGIVGAQDTGGGDTDIIIGIENLIGSGYGDLLIGDDGANLLSGEEGDDLLFGMAGDDRLQGGVGNDSLSGGLDDDTLVGGSGDDTLSGGLGSNRLFGGDGSDTASYAEATGGVEVRLGTIALQQTGGAGLDLILGVENLTGSIFDDTLIGDGAANIIVDGPGSDTVTGNGGTDTFYLGQIEGDQYDGGSGTDLLIVDDPSVLVVDLHLGIATGDSAIAPADALVSIENVHAGSGPITLIGSNDTNALTGSPGNDTLDGGAGGDTLDGGAGSDTADYSASGEAVVVASDGAFAIGGDADGDVLASIENLLGSAFADFLRGDGQANVLTGGAGADYIQGRGGDDTLNGGENDDLLEPGAGADTVDGGAGQDLLSALDAAGPVTINLGNVALSSAGYADKTLISIEGVLGVAGFGNTLVGGGGEDLLIGGDVADSIAGAGGADILLGLGGADTISGGAGDDLILGLEGDDVLTGDAGRDLFLFEPGDGADVVTDFELPVGGAAFEDRLFFSGLGLTFADLDIAEVGGDVVIGYGTNPAAFDGSVTVEGVTLADLVPGGAQPDWILVF